MLNRRPTNPLFGGTIGQGNLGQRPLLPPGALPTPRPATPVPAGTQEWERQMGNVAPRSRAGRAESEIYLGPQAIANDTNELFRLLSSSPAFAQMLQSITQQGSQMNTGFQSALGRTGLSSTGIGAAAGGLAKSATSNAMTGARGELFSQALNTALQALSERLAQAQGLSESRRHVSWGRRIGDTLLGTASSAATARAGRPRQ